MIIQEYQQFRFGSPVGLKPDQMKNLIGLFNRAPDRASAALGGRNQPQIVELAEWGVVVIKHYFRGGLIRHFNRRTYLKLTKTRGQAEFEMLDRIRKLGVNTPEPVAFADKGRLFYRAWLVTKLIPDAETLADLSRSAPNRAKAIMPSVIQQVNILIHAGILHPDLHPGNVLIDEQGNAFVIDLDKAKSAKDCTSLRLRYRKRWQRAVTKYGLADFLRDRMNAGLEDGYGEV